MADANDTGRTLSAESRPEQAVLRVLSSLPAGQARSVEGATVVAESPYTAASGRTCRALRLETGERHGPRLACRGAQGWFFVPDVFGSADADVGGK